MRYCPPGQAGWQRPLYSVSPSGHVVHDDPKPPSHVSQLGWHAVGKTKHTQSSTGTFRLTLTSYSKNNNRVAHDAVILTLTRYR